MRYTEALNMIHEEFDECGNSIQMMGRPSTHTCVMKSQSGILKECTGDWPMQYFPTIEDLNATDWIIIKSTGELYP